MQREIKFRGWDANKAEWIYGFYIVSPSLLITKGKNYILEFIGIESGEPIYDWHEVIPESVGQFTGLKDKNGIEIYEGDIIKDILIGIIWEVKFGFCVKYAFTGWYIENKDIQLTSTINNDSDSVKNSNIEIIGNIYENLNLLK